MINPFKESASFLLFLGLLDGKACLCLSGKEKQNLRI